ncbi:unnamed protein product [Aspergillus oryzae]|uniref:Unnamed protein product n=2 Tax=Aspergillus oryzae TaxID=5062 RepID=A0AAN5BWR8_ASPOZ|nr:unnamed protein product [Aspergillus oryzae]GMF88914.1 unnamed protein product [Aspergillus oryzae]GMG09962.1 unnamed protein product [Aspergillus oryzae]GMG28222.1 unnamed protein product [Aspergillus oryzae]GMG44466.1 unnamed protein product [Aspergillus oryzae var. brunneus]
MPTRRFVSDSHKQEHLGPLFPLTNPITGVLSHQAADNVKKHGKDNDLLERIRRTEFFNPILGELDTLLEPSTFVGRAPQQVEKFTSTEVKKALEPYAAAVAKAETSTLSV